VALGAPGPHPTWTVGVPWQSPYRPGVWIVQVFTPDGVRLRFEARQDEHTARLVDWSGDREAAHGMDRVRAFRYATQAIDAVRA